METSNIIIIVMGLAIAAVVTAITDAALQAWQQRRFAKMDGCERQETEDREPLADDDPDASCHAASYRANLTARRRLHAEFPGQALATPSLPESSRIASNCG